MSVQRTPLEVNRVYLMLLLLCIHAGLLVYLAVRDAPTIDEVAHLPAGISHITSGDLSLYRVNPPLVRTVAALPVLALNPRLDWIEFRADVIGRQEFLVGQRFCELNRNNLQRLFIAARCACIPFSLLGAVLVTQWANQLLGMKASLLALIMWVFSPHILAHGHLITPDVPATSFTLGACYAFWLWSRSGSLVDILLAGCSWALAVLCKTTALLLLPVFVLQLIWFRKNVSPSAPRLGLAKTAVHLLSMSVFAWAAVNQFYGWSGSFRPLGDYEFVSETLKDSHGTDSGNRFRGTWLANVPAPAPADFLSGIDLQKRDFESALESYLRGEIRYGGWWHYYLYGLLVKSPIGSLALFASAVVMFLRTDDVVKTSSLIGVALIPAAITIGIVSSQTGFNHHLRYVLPALPFLMIWCSQAVFWQSGWRRILLCWTPLLLAVVESLSVYPFSLSFFNRLVGGPSEGHLHMVDSNADWGQDLLRLAKWHDSHPEARPFYLASFTIVDPRIYGMEFSLPPGREQLPANESPEQSLSPGWYAISVHRLHGLRRVQSADGQGRWSQTGDYTYFQDLTPSERVGYSYLIYHLPGRTEALPLPNDGSPR